MNIKMILTLLSPAVLMFSAHAGQSPWEFSDTYINGRHIAQIITEAESDSEYHMDFPSDKYVPMHNLQITKSGNRTDIRIEQTLSSAEYLTLSSHEGGANIVVDELIRLESADNPEDYEGYRPIGLAILGSGRNQTLTSPRFEINYGLNQSGGLITLTGKTFNLHKAFMHTPDKITIKPLDIELPIIHSLEIRPLRFSYEGKILPGACESYGCIVEGELDFTACRADLNIYNASFTLFFNRQYLLNSGLPATNTHENYNPDRRFVEDLLKAFS